MVEYMKDQLQQLEAQRKRAKEALADIEKTISEIKSSTGYKIYSMLEKEKMNGIKKIWPRADGTHVLFADKEITAEQLERFKRFRLNKVYFDNGTAVAVFE